MGTHGCPEPVPGFRGDTATPPPRAWLCPLSLHTSCPQQGWFYPQGLPEMSGAAFDCQLRDGAAGLLGRVPGTPWPGTPASEPPHSWGAPYQGQG